MKRLLIYGEPDAGKTTTCHKIMKTLLSFGASMQRYEQICDNDFLAVLDVHGIKIVIYSAGDENAHLRYSLEFAEGCAGNILITTVRSYVKYNDPLSRYQEGIDFEWRTLTKGNTAKERRYLSNAMALSIVTEINDFIHL